MSPFPHLKPPLQSILGLVCSGSGRSLGGVAAFIDSELERDRARLVTLPKRALIMMKGSRLISGHGRRALRSRLTDGHCMGECMQRIALRRINYGDDELAPHVHRPMASTCSGRCKVCMPLTDCSRDVLVPTMLEIAA